MRRPAIICVVSAAAIETFLLQGVGHGLALSESLRARARAVARSEIENIANLMETEPMGLQFGLLTSAEPSGEFQILRSRDRAMLAINPFRSDTIPHATAGVAMVTSADEALNAYQRVAESLWREAVKGSAGAKALRDILQRVRP